MKVKSIKADRLSNENGLRLRLEVNNLSLEEREELEILKEHVIKAEAVVFEDWRAGTDIIIAELYRK